MKSNEPIEMSTIWTIVWALLGVHQMLQHFVDQFPLFIFSSRLIISI